MQVVAVCTPYLIMSAVMVLARSNVRPVVGGEVGACARIALRGPGMADVGSVAPLEAC